MIIVEINMIGINMERKKGVFFLFVILVKIKLIFCLVKVRRWLNIFDNIEIIVVLKVVCNNMKLRISCKMNIIISGFNLIVFLLLLIKKVRFNVINKLIIFNK